MPTLTERANLGDLLKFEAPNLYSRERVTIAAGQNLVLGTILGKRTVSGEVQALAPTATDGTEVATGILAVDIDATLISREDGVMIARHATVSRVALVWPPAITVIERNTAIQQLETLGIVVRESA